MSGVDRDQVHEAVAALVAEKRRLVAARKAMPKGAAEERAARKAAQLDIDRVAASIRDALRTLARGRVAYGGRPFASKDGAFKKFALHFAG